MINIFSLLVLCLVTCTNHRVDGEHSKVKEDLELERQLMLINKPPIKSIHTKFGYIIDCIDINKQPAFDHPSLKKHKLQRQPSFPMTNESVKISPTIKFGLDKIMCPTGTVPIRRTTKDDLIRAKSLWNNNTITTNDGVRSHTAFVVLIKDQNKKYYGVSGTTAMYNPKCTIAQASTSFLYMKNGGEGDGTNIIMAGWHVFPHIYKDDKTHLFASWTVDNFKNTGCYNVLCQGFVQISRQYYLGQLVPETSVYGGLMVELPISIFQDPATKNWWLTFVDTKVGYFPAALFSNLATSEELGWGGSSIAIDFPNPAMGSGYFPDETFGHACYFTNIAYKNASNSPNYRPDIHLIREYNDAPECFGVEYYKKGGPPFENSLQFGGPGGNC